MLIYIMYPSIKYNSPKQTINKSINKQIILINPSKSKTIFTHKMKSQSISSFNWWDFIHTMCKHFCNIFSHNGKFILFEHVQCGVHTTICFATIILLTFSHVVQMNLSCLMCFILSEERHLYDLKNCGALKICLWNR